MWFVKMIIMFFLFKNDFFKYKWKLNLFNWTLNIEKECYSKTLIQRLLNYVFDNELKGYYKKLKLIQYEKGSWL